MAGPSYLLLLAININDLPRQATQGGSRKLIKYSTAVTSTPQQLLALLSSSYLCVDFLRVGASTT